MSDKKTQFLDRLNSIYVKEQDVGLNEKETKQKEILEKLISTLNEEESQTRPTSTSAILSEGQGKGEGKGKDHSFWNTQPMINTSYTEGKIQAQMTQDEATDAVKGLQQLSVLEKKTEDIEADRNAEEKKKDKARESGIVAGPIEEKKVEDVSTEPLALDPSLNLSWCSIDLSANSSSSSSSSSSSLSSSSPSSSSSIDEIYNLLYHHYVEDSDNMFRFDYSRDFLLWALTPPHSSHELIVGLRATRDSPDDPDVKVGSLMGLITGVPTQVVSYGQERSFIEINFLCVHKSLRSKRLAPVLIQEITRRTNLMNIWQAVYTAGVEIPTPIGKCRYYHRQLNPKKLVEVKFTRLPHGLTLSKLIKNYKLDTEGDHVMKGLRKENDSKEIKNSGMEIIFRPMEGKDVVGVTSLLNNYLSTFNLYIKFSEEEVAHWLLPRPAVVSSFVIEKRYTSKFIKDYKKKHGGVLPPEMENYSELLNFCSYYFLPSTVIGNDKHNTLYVTYSFYNVPSATFDMKFLLQCLLIEGKKEGVDVMNCLNLSDNEDPILRSLKFGPGDGNLHYYLFNWKCPKLEAKDIAIVLL